MKDARLELLMSYMKSNVAPILVDFIGGDSIPESIILPANVEKTELNGHYESTEFMPPKWLQQLKDIKLPVLVIDKIDSISKEEQTKFIEILKYKKISTFELPKNTIIIITAEKVNETTINEEIYSLVAHIEG